MRTDLIIGITRMGKTERHTGRCEKKSRRLKKFVLYRDRVETSEPKKEGGLGICRGVFSIVRGILLVGKCRRKTRHGMTAFTIDSDRMEKLVDKILREGGGATSRAGTPKNFLEIGHGAQAGSTAIAWGRKKMKFRRGVSSGHFSDFLRLPFQPDEKRQALLLLPESGEGGDAVFPLFLRRIKEERVHFLPTCRKETDGTPMIGDSNILIKRFRQIERERGLAV